MLRPGPRFTIILEVKEYHNFKAVKFTLRKTVFKSYSESQLLCDPAENVHGVLIRKKYQTDFCFVSFYLHLKFSTLKLRYSLSLRNESGTRIHVKFANACADRLS